VNNSYTYQGFTATVYCNAGWTWDQENGSASTYYGCASSSSDDITNGGCTTDSTGSWHNSTVNTTYSTSQGNLSDAWLGLYFDIANFDYGLPLNNGSGDSFYASYSNYSHSVQSGYSNNSTADVDSRDPTDATVPNYCSYNVLTNCNSDCWIGDFSTRQGAICPTISPCW
jgi:hypothetical protein